MSGSERNHVPWRFANATLRWASSVDRLPRGSGRRRARPRPRGSRSPRTRQRRVEPLARGPRPRRSGRRRTGRGRASAIHSRCVGGLDAAGRARRPARGSRGAGAAGASPCSSAISRARATRRGLREVDASPRGSARAGRSRATSGARPSRREPRPRGARGRRVRRERVGVEAARDRAQVQPGAADEDRDAAAAGDAGERLRGVAHEVRDGERLVGLDEVEAVMRDAGAAPRRRPWPCRCRGRGRPAANRPR